MASLGGAVRPGCHHFGVTPFYDENSLTLLLKTFEDVVASVNVSFMRSKVLKPSQPKATFFCFAIIGLIELLSMIAMFARSSRKNMWKPLSFYRRFYL